MRKILGALAMAMAALLLSGSAALAAKNQTKAEIKAFLDQTAASFSKLDLEAVSATALPDAKIVYLDGRSLSPVQWREWAGRELAGVERLSASFKLLKLKGKGDSVRVKYRETDVFTKKAEPGVEYGLVSTWKAILVRTPQGWRFKELRQTAAKPTRDGKPMAPPLAAK